MRVLILGGTNFIGPQVVRRLVRQGHDVICFHRGRTSASLPDEVEHILGERERLTDFRDRLRAIAPEALLDMRAMTERDARLAVDALRGVVRRTVVVSSCDVYRAFAVLNGFESVPVIEGTIDEESELRTRLFPMRDESPRAESDPMRWADDYDKILVERTYRAEMHATVVRLPMVYGPGDSRHRTFPYVRRMLDGRAFILLGERHARWRGVRGFVGNVAAGIAVAVTDPRAAGRTYNLGDHCLEEAAWVRAIGQAIGWNGVVAVTPDKDLPETLQGPTCPEQHLDVNISRLRGELDFVEEVGLHDALRATAAWERDNPPAEADEVDYAQEDRLFGKATAV